jgi:hypothetical protein
MNQVLTLPALYHESPIGARTPMSARIKSKELADKAVRAPVRRRFMVPMRAQQRKTASHEPRSRRRGSAHVFAFPAKGLAPTHVGDYRSGVQRANRFVEISPRKVVEGGDLRQAQVGRGGASEAARVQIL